LIRNNPGCWVIPIRDKDAIKERILFAYNNRDICKQTGEYARYNMQNYSMELFMQELADYLESKV
jgi:glycosyltransferase involved in cell wall biosynthesis